MKILITGSRGFIGYSIGQHAARGGHEIVGVGRSSLPREGWAGRYIQADVGQADLAKIIAGFAPDLLVHAAGSASVGGSMAAPLDDFRGSVLAWVNVLDSVRRSRQKPLIVFPSSAAVYGNPTRLPVSEDAPIAPISPYGFHKAACELLAREYTVCFDLDILICRLFSVFGELQRRLLVWDLYAQCVGSEPIVWLEGTGEEARDYLHVEEVAAAILALSQSGSCSEQRRECSVVNVASGEETKVLDVAKRLRTLVAHGKDIRCRGLARPGDPLRWCADISRLRTRAASWQARPFLTRLRSCVADWQAQSEKVSRGG